MKKVFFTIMAAVVLMSCGGSANDPEISANDKKAMKKVSSEAVAQLGENKANVNTYLTSAGYVKVDANVNLYMPAPARKKGFETAKASEADTINYVYGVNVNAISDYSSSQAAIESALGKNGAVIALQAIFYEGKLVELESGVLMNVKSNVKPVFIEISDSLYNAIPANAVNTQWFGYINDETECADHAEFDAAIAGSQATQAQEAAFIVTKVDVSTMTFEGYGYGNYLYVPTDEEAEAMKKESGFSFATVSFGVLDYNWYVLNHSK